MAYHVVHIPEGNPPVCFTFASKEEIAIWFNNLDNLSCHVFVFKGDRLLLTGGTFRYLMENDNAFPLFKQPFPGAISAESSLEELLNLDPTYAELTPKFNSTQEAEIVEEDEE